MARGLLMGTVSGLAFAAVVLGVASLLAPQPAGNRPPETPATELGSGIAPGPEASQAGAAPGSAAPMAEAGEAAAPPAAPAATAEGGLPLADTSPAAVPEISRADELAAPPETGGETETGAVAALAAPDAPVAQPGPGPAPQLPAAEAGPELSTEPAARPAPLAPALDAPAEPAGVPTMPATDAGTPAPAAAPAAAAPDAGAGDAPAVADTGSPGQPAVADAVADAAALPPAAEPGADAPPPAPEAGAPDAAAPPEAEATAPDSPPDQPATEAAPALPGGDTGVGGNAVQAMPEPALPGGDTGVRVNRPSLALETPAAPAPDQAEEAAEDAPARIRHAADFTDPGGLPHLSIVVIDDGSMAAGPTILSSIPFPVTVAIDPARADAAAAMAAYRAAGIEVAALAALPEGAGATDVNVNLQAAFATLPETVALVDPGDGGLSADPALAAAALARLAEGGRGFVWMEGGLDPLSGLAADAGVPGAAILRDLDGAGQDAATIRRFIDNAAFQARRDGAVVLLARLRPETVSALTLWGTANRARQVTMAPLSAVLNGM